MGVCSWEVLGLVDAFALGANVLYRDLNFAGASTTAATNSGHPTATTAEATLGYVGGVDDALAFAPGTVTHFAAPRTLT